MFEIITPSPRHVHVGAVCGPVQLQTCHLKLFVDIRVLETKHSVHIQTLG